MVSLALAAVLAQGSPQSDLYQPSGPRIRWTLTNGRSFVITTDPRNSPKTTEHIVSLVKSGFYDRQRVHRVESWVTQWGAPASKTEPMDKESVTGGGSGKQLPFEESQVDYLRGVCGIASTGLQVGGDSQIFILKKDTPRLYRSYAVLGKVTEGMDVVGTIQRGDRFRRAEILR